MSNCNLDLDFGVNTDTNYQSIAIDKNELVELEQDIFGNHINTNYEDKNQILLVSDDDQLNPFYVKLNNSSLRNMDDKTLYSNYKRILILCPKDDCPQNFNVLPLLNIISPKIEFNKCATNFVLVNATNKILKNNRHKKMAIIVEKCHLKPFNHNNLELNIDEIVVPIVELKESDIKMYINLYQGQYKLKELVKAIILSDYFNCNKYYLTKNNISIMTKHINESAYWLYSWNCKMNLTSHYLKRKFNYSNNNSKNIKALIRHENKDMDKNVKDVLETLNNNPQYIQDVCCGTDYLQFMYRKKIYTDASLAIYEKTGYKLYRIDNSDLEITKDQISELFSKIPDSDERTLYDLFNALLLSKKYCHMVLNNKFVLNKMSCIIKKFMPIYRYILGYPWLCMTMEECIVKTRTSTNNRFVFDIDTANKLPIIPFCTEDPHLNPYFTMLVNKKVIDSSNNCHGIAWIKDYKDHGIDNLDGFKKKFNIFTTGSSKSNIFDGLETESNSKKWKHFAVGGSSIPSCSLKRHPLIDTLIDKQQPYDDIWSRFFNEYHADSDIDLMCNKVDVFDFMNECNKMINVVKNNLDKFYGPESSNKLELGVTKTVLIIVSTKYIEQCMKNDYSSDYVIESFQNDEIKDYFYERYVHFKHKKTKLLRNKYNVNNNPLFKYYFKLSTQNEINIMLTETPIDQKQNEKFESDIYLHLNDVLSEDQKVNDEDNIIIFKISESIKFKLESPNLLHNIEVFRTKFAEIFSCVSRFHLPCVRGYYDGNNVYMLPSFITSLMTYTNTNYKYFAGIRDPIDILIKYRARGFGIIINDNEKIHMTKYIGKLSKLNKWNGMFSIDLNNKKSIEKFYGCKELTDNIFKPGHFNKGFPMDTYLVPQKSYVKTIDDLYNTYKELYDYDYNKASVNFFDFRTINENGSIRPFEKWILDAAYSILK